MKRETIVPVQTILNADRTATKAKREKIMDRAPKSIATHFVFLHVEQELDHIAILDNIFLAFGAQQAGFATGGFAAFFNEVVV